ncbi:MAG TPA: FAD-dependent oxidoreductase [Caldilineaceae bacterium]|nr:FAD-dependent oxidoreductase [Caldilineaceae bacterium]
MTHYTYLLIGGGMSAGAAVEGIRSMDQEGSIGIITIEANRPYDRPPLSKGLWKGKTTPDEILHEMPDGVTLHTECWADTLDIAQKQVTDGEGNQYTYEKLLLAMGGFPKQLALSADEDIVYYRTLADYHRLRDLVDTYDSFAVIGGSFIGSELAAALCRNGKDVTMLFPEEAICAKIFPTDLAGYLNRYYESMGVHIYPETTLAAIEGSLGNYQLSAAQRTTIAADVIVAGIGIRPNTDLAATAGLQVDNGIVVNDHLQTSAPDIYAAGDVARFQDQVLHEWRRVEHEDNAVTMGKTAGRAMAGSTETYDHSPMFYSDLFDLGYEAVGHLSAEMDTYIDWQEEYKKGVIYYLNENRVRGVLLWNVWEQVAAARDLIAAGKQLSPQALRGRLS